MSDPTLTYLTPSPSGDALVRQPWMEHSSRTQTGLQRALQALEWRSSACSETVAAVRKDEEPVLPLSAGIDEMLAALDQAKGAHIVLHCSTRDQYWRAGVSDVLGMTPILTNLIENRSDEEMLASSRNRLADVLKEALSCGTSALLLLNLVSDMAETLHHIAIHQAIQEMGDPPPCPFMFMVMGSEGRNEQTLKTDQDNAIVFKGDEEAHQAYFIRLGDKINRMLDAYGFDYCRGDIMARNPKWCRNLTAWKAYFTKWVSTPDPMAVMHTTIFFDFRYAYGDAGIGDELRTHLNNLLQKRSELFFYHLAQNTIGNAIPLGFFGGFKYPSGVGLDMKKAMLPAVNYARIFALKNGISETNTIRRLRLIAGTEHLSKTDAGILIRHYRALMKVRLEHQIARILERNRTADNFIIPEDYPAETQAFLKEAFKKMRDLQKRLGTLYRSGY
ncbi:CBS domain-containing protein [Cyclonatronum proteinivorum]|uniref:CBS domain-containing protein n=1 Tax=Cyclonatronum proteinivorum TaxID=1457365 RepID=A0A345ULX6_9BACT|nr:DUF294 nucleotidyltransferase-like domain-containing protein [Cyclonatronum proteinivorum]AXJ01478.1 CBS domain-containing protein [Cyclonatronum proteinivorum]